MALPLSILICSVFLVLAILPFPHKAIAQESATMHWAYAPLEEQVPALPSEDAWCNNPIDGFVLDKLRETGLSPSPPADKVTLIRRANYSLHGLPPTPEEVQDFLEDDSLDAYEKVLDRLLDSPRYGERWARHWLDVAHYGETHGFDKDQRRPNAWPYRDYVIRAFNEDKPYAEFIKEQIAGDILGRIGEDGTIATGFISAGPWDLVGHTEVREDTIEKARVRNLDRDDMLSNVFNTFLSTTVQCARCHDHKFDPISLREYYSLQAVFAGVERGDKETNAVERKEAQEKIQSDIESATAKLEETLAQFTEKYPKEMAEYAAREAELKQSIATLETETSKATSPSNGFHSNIFTSPDESQWVQVELKNVSALESVVLFPARPVDFPDTPGFGFPLQFKVSISETENFENEIVLLDYAEVDTPNPGDNPLSIPAHGMKAKYVHVTAGKLWERNNDYIFALAEVQVISGGENIALHQKVNASSSIESGLWASKNLVDGFDSRKPLQETAEQEERDKKKELRGLRASLTQLKEKELGFIKANMSEDEYKGFEQQGKTLEELEKKLADVPAARMAYAINTIPPRPIHLLARGNESSPGEEVHAAPWGVFPELKDEFTTLSEEDGGGARLALAGWISDKNNPLTWRSIANRIWQYHFGQGIVETPNDFGVMGATPSHPELLDWLALEFRDGGATFKRMHKLILLSSTYRQSSAHRPECAAHDSANRYLWRMNRAKLDADAFRDSVMHIAGTLVLQMGGPSVDLFAYEFDHSPRYNYGDSDQPDVWRRSVYRSIVRSVPDPFMEALDCADPNVSTPVRNATLTANQALAVFNDPFMLNQTRHFAKRLNDMHGDLDAKIHAAFSYLFLRQPTEKEMELSVEFASQHGLENALRALWNTNEFMFID